MMDNKIWYCSFVTEKEVTGLGGLNNESAQPRNAAFLCAYASLRLQWAAVVGKPQGLPVCFRAGPPTLSFAALPAYSGQRFNRIEGGQMARTDKFTQFQTATTNQQIYLSAKLQNKSDDNLSDFEKLPFVYRPKRGFNNSSNWHVPPTSSYTRACEIGQEYALHFVQFLKDNPD